MANLTKSRRAMLRQRKYRYVDRGFILLLLTVFQLVCAVPVVFEDEFGATRDEVREALLAQNVYSRKYFYPLTSDFECYAGRFDSSKTPVAAHAAQRVLTLPMYADLALADVDRICDTVLVTSRA